MINVNFVGRLGADAELRQDKFMRNFVAFNVAVDEYRNGQNETVWLRVTDNSERIMKMQPHLKKGTMVSVHGVESVRMFTSANGTMGVSRDVRADRVEFVKSGSGNSTTTSTPQATVVSTPSTSPSPQSEPNMQDITCGTFDATTNIAPIRQMATVPSSDIEDDLPF